MKKIFVFAALSLAIGFTSCGTSETADKKKEETVEAKVNQIDVKEFHTGITGKTAYQLIDVRTPQEFESGYIETAKNFNVNGADFAKQIADLDKNIPTYVYCKAGSRGTNASQILINNGFKNVNNLKGGMMSWAAAEKPVASKKMSDGQMTVEAYQELINSHDVVLVDFNAPWCGPCKQMKPIIDELEETYKGKVHVVEINIDNAEALTKELGISSIPYFAINKGGEQVWGKLGAMPKDSLVAAIENNIED